MVKRLRSKFDTILGSAKAGLWIMMSLLLWCNRFFNNNGRAQKPRNFTQMDLVADSRMMGANPVMPHPVYQWDLPPPPPQPAKNSSWLIGVGQSVVDTRYIHVWVLNLLSPDVFSGDKMVKNALAAGVPPDSLAGIGGNEREEERERGRKEALEEVGRLKWGERKGREQERRRRRDERVSSSSAPKSATGDGFHRPFDNCRKK